MGREIKNRGSALRDKTEAQLWEWQKAFEKKGRGKRYKLLRVSLGILKRYRDPYYQGLAAELAFYFIMSIVPIFILLAVFLGAFSISLDLVADLIQQYAGDNAARVLNRYLTSSSGTFNVIFMVFALWGASKIQFSMVRISNYAYTGRANGNGYIRERLRAILNIALLLVMLTGSLIILVYGEMLLGLINSLTFEVFKVQFDIGKVWFVVRWLIAIALYFFTVSYNYYALPAKKLPYRRFLPGSIAASLAIVVSTWCYSIYVTRFANYDALYGSLASIVALLFWFYILGTILVMGILINVVWYENSMD